MQGMQKSSIEPLDFVHLCSAIGPWADLGISAAAAVTAVARCFQGPAVHASNWGVSGTGTCLANAVLIQTRAYWCVRQRMCSQQAMRRVDARHETPVVTLEFDASNGDGRAVVTATDTEPIAIDLRVNCCAGRYRC